MTKVYTLPDPNVSKLWVREVQPTCLVHFTSNGKHLYYVDGNGGVFEPTPGRWLPVSLPTFPERKRAAIRLCRAKRPRDKEPVMLAWRRNPQLAFPFIDFDGCNYSTKDITDIEWLTPEFEDELPQGIAT